MFLERQTSKAETPHSPQASPTNCSTNSSPRHESRSESFAAQWAGGAVECGGSDFAWLALVQSVGKQKARTRRWCMTTSWVAKASVGCQSSCNDSGFQTLEKHCMKKMSHSKLLFAAFCVLLATVCGAQDTPQTTTAAPFAEYPAKEVIVSVPPSNLRFNSAQARRFHTAIRDASKEKPNFAGHYRIAIWGCGTDCRGFAIIDLLSGSVTTPKGIETISGVMGNDDPRLDFSADSQLLVISGQINEDSSTEARYLYKWNGKSLLLIGKQPLAKMQF
jgi:hypothetical protein